MMYANVCFYVSLIFPFWISSKLLFLLQVMLYVVIAVLVMFSPLYLYGIYVIISHALLPKIKEKEYIEMVNLERECVDLESAHENDIIL